jgi:hypothetical protein
VRGWRPPKEAHWLIFLTTDVVNGCLATNVTEFGWSRL